MVTFSNQLMTIDPELDGAKDRQAVARLVEQEKSDEQ